MLSQDGVVLGCLFLVVVRCVCFPFFYVGHGVYQLEVFSQSATRVACLASGPAFEVRGVCSAYCLFVGCGVVAFVGLRFVGISRRREFVPYREGRSCEFGRVEVRVPVFLGNAVRVDCVRFLL